MREIGVLEAKTRLSALLDDVGRGEEMVITRNGKPVARLAPLNDAHADVADRVRALRERIAKAAAGVPSLDLDAEFDRLRGRD